MRRYVLYLAVALLAFGIGTLAVFKFYWIGEDKPVLNETNITTVTGTEKNFGTGTGSAIRRMNEPIFIPSIPKLYKPTCRDKKLLPVWNELRKDKSFRERAAEEFNWTADCSTMLDVNETDLNDDGRKEIILQGNNPNLCQRDTCLVWIFEKKGNRYKQILQTEAAMKAEVSNYKDERGLIIGNTKTFGYKAITAAGGNGVFWAQYTYQFDGNKYRQTKCLAFEYYASGEEPSVETCEEKWKK